MIEYRFLRCNYDALTSQENMALDVSRIILQPTFELTTIDCQPCFDCFGAELCKVSNPSY